MNDTYISPSATSYYALLRHITRIGHKLATCRHETTATTVQVADDEQQEDTWTRQCTYCQLVTDSGEGRI